MNLTAEQREALMGAIVALEDLNCKELADGSIISVSRHLTELLRDLLSGSIRCGEYKWEVTDGRRQKTVEKIKALKEAQP